MRVSVVDFSYFSWANPYGTYAMTEHVSLEFPAQGDMLPLAALQITPTFYFPLVYRVITYFSSWFNRNTCGVGTKIGYVIVRVPVLW